MEISIIKKKAKEIYSENRKQYILIAITYFIVTLLLTVASTLLNAAIDHRPDVPFWGEHSNNLYVSYSIKFLETIMSTFFLLWIYSLAYRKSYFKHINDNNNDKTMGFILSKSILLGFVLFMMTAPFGVVADILYPPDNFVTIIFITTIKIIVVIITFHDYRVNSA